MRGRVIRLMPWLLFIGLTFLLGSRFFEPMPTAGAAGEQTGATCNSAASGARGRQSFLSKHGLRIAVVTPTDYDGVHRYGLLVMFPPAGFTSEASERFYQLTQQATEAGYLIAFSNSVPLSTVAIKIQGDVVNEVVSKWCIDEERIVLAGHSDGGSLAQGIVLRHAAGETQPSGIFTSAAGIQDSDLQNERCPSPRRVSVIHSASDERFPKFGQGVANWWAQCFTCESLPVIPTGQTCIDAASCAGVGAVRYCETSGTHAQLSPSFRDEIRGFLTETKK